MTLGPVERDGLGRFSEGSARARASRAQAPQDQVRPAPGQIRAGRSPRSGRARPSKSHKTSRALDRCAGSHGMGREPRGHGDDTPDEAQAAPIQFSLRERLQLTAQGSPSPATLMESTATTATRQTSKSTASQQPPSVGDRRSSFAARPHQSRNAGRATLSRAVHGATTAYLSQSRSSCAALPGARRGAVTCKTITTKQ